MKKIDELRQEIGTIDVEIFELLKKRFEYVHQVGEYKKQNNLPVRNQQREAQLIEDACIKTGLEKEFIEKYYQLIFNKSYKIEA